MNQNKNIYSTGSPAMVASSSLCPVTAPLFYLGCINILSAPCSYKQHSCLAPPRPLVPALRNGLHISPPY